MIVPPDGANRFEDPQTFLLAVLNNPGVKLAERVAIALRLLPYLHHKMPERKEARAELAAMSGRFAVRDAPNADPDWHSLLERN